MFETLGQMVAEGLSIIFISHKLAEVLRVSTRVAVLRGGKLVALNRVQVLPNGKEAKVDWINDVSRLNGNHLMKKQ